MLPKNGLEWLAGGNTVRRTANPRRFTPVPVSADLSETSVDDSTASESSASENAPDTVKSKKQRKLEKREAWEAVQAALTELSETSASDSDAEIQAVIKSRQQRKQEAKEAYGRRLENEGNERNGITKDKVCKCKVVHFDEESLLRARAQSTERKQELSIDSCTCDCVACNKALEEYLKVCGPSECQSKENTKRETKSCLKPSNRDTGSTKQQSGQPKQNICGCANNQQSDSASSKHSSPNNNDKDQQQRRINSLDQPKTNEDKVQQQSEVSDYYQQNNMSRLITESRAEVIIREDVIENPHLDPRPNAFYDAKCGVLRVYHGPNWGNATGSLIPVPASAFPPGNLPHMGPQPPPMFAPYMQFPMQPGGTPPFGFPYPHGYHPPPMHPNMSYGTIPNANPAELRPQSRNKGDDAPEKRDEGASPTRNNGKEKANTASTTSWDTSEPKSSSTMNSNVHAKPTGANEKPRPQWNTGKRDCRRDLSMTDNSSSRRYQSRCD